MTDASDNIILTQYPVTVNLAKQSPATVQIVGTDNAGLSPAGWGWVISPVFPGAPPAQVFAVPFAGGASQSLADLMPSTSAPTAYTPILVTGIPSAGQVITATSPVAADWASPGSGLALDTTASDIQPLGTRAAGAVGLAADAGHVHATTNIIAGVTVSGTPVAGNALTATSGSAAGWATPAAGVTLDTTATDIQALGTRAAGAVGKAADAGHVHPLTGVASIDTTATDIQPLGTRAAGATGLAADAGHVHATTSIIAGVTVSGTPVAGNALTATSGSAAGWATPAAGVTLDTTATDIAALGTRAAGATGKAADAGHVHPTTGIAAIDATSTDIAALGTRAAGAVGLAADAGHVHPTTGLQTAVIDSTATDIVALGTQAAGATGKLADAGHVHPTTGVFLLAGGTLTGWLAPAVVTLTFGTTMAVNAALGNVFAVTLTASTGTVSNPTNPVDGQVIRFRLIQDATGSRSVAWGTAYDWGAGNTAPALIGTASKVDIAAFEYVASITKWVSLGAAFPQGY